jgi:hypothetical protein
MSEVRLYLDGELVDIDPNTVVVETKQINDFFEFQGRQASFTKDFNIPLTNISSKVLDRIGDTYNTSIKPYRNIKADLYRGGTSTIIDGTFNIKTVLEKKYVRGSIQDGINSLFTSMGNKSIASLNFSGITHKFEDMTVLSSFTNEWEQGYIYAFSDFGLFDETDVDLRYQVPSLFMRWIFDQIFIDSGFTYSYRGNDNPFESADFKTKIISLNKGFVFKDVPDAPVLKLEIDGLDTVTEDGRVYMRLIEVYDPDNYHSVSSSPNENQSLIIPLVGDARIVIELDGNTLYTIEEQFGFSHSVFVYLSINSNIKVYSESISGADYSYDFTFKMFIDSGNNVINFNSYLSNLKQKDFFKAILQMYGLIVQREKGTNNYEFIKIEELFLNRTDAQDLSDKQHKFISQKFDYKNYGQVNDLKYNYDDSGADFADGFFYIDDETISKSTTLLTLPFKAPKLSGTSFNDEFLFETPLFEVQRNDDGTIKEVKPKNSTAYIMNVGVKNGSFDYNTGGATVSYTGSIAIANFEGLNFNLLISNNYSSFVRTIGRAKIAEVEMELSGNDVYQFDFLRLIYLRNEQRYYYCNKIINFRENKVTKMSLLEVNTSRQTTGEYSDDYNNDYNI